MENAGNVAATPAVPKDPQPSVDRIDELARRILTSDIILPKFQRRFVWDERQVVVLWDSIARGYPIGSVLLWHSREELRSERNIADLAIDLPQPDYPYNYLLDGQQRLSSICGAIYWKPDDPKNRWNIAYDLREKKIVRLDTLDEPPLHQIRINKLEDPARFFQQVASLRGSTSPGAVEQAGEAEALFRRFKDYKIATVTLWNTPLSDVAPIFERINSTGTRLTIVDLMRAATWTPEFDLFESIDSILDSLDAKNFEQLDSKVVLRNISAAAGGNFSSDSIETLRKLRDRDPEKLDQACTDVDAAYRRAVDFVHDQLGVPSANALPYANQMVVLAELFRLIPTPTVDQRRSMGRWFWMTAVGGYFGGWNTTQMSADRRALQAFARGEPLATGTPLRAYDADSWLSQDFRVNSAASKVLGILLASTRPQDLLTGQFIDLAKALAWSNDREFHHFFPQKYMKRTAPAERRVNSLANIVLLTSASNKRISSKAPSEYLASVEEAAGTDLQKWLDSNLISAQAYDAAKRDDFDTFLAERKKTIDRTLGKFLNYDGTHQTGIIL